MEPEEQLYINPNGELGQSAPDSMTSDEESTLPPMDEPISDSMVSDEESALPLIDEPISDSMASDEESTLPLIDEPISDSMASDEESTLPPMGEQTMTPPMGEQTMTSPMPSLTSDKDKIVTFLKEVFERKKWKRYEVENRLRITEQLKIDFDMESSEYNLGAILFSYIFSKVNLDEEEYSLFIGDFINYIDDEMKNACGHFNRADTLLISDSERSELGKTLSEELQTEYRSRAKNGLCEILNDRKDMDTFLSEGSVKLNSLYDIYGTDFLKEDKSVDYNIRVTSRSSGEPEYFVLSPKGWPEIKIDITQFNIKKEMIETTGTNITHLLLRAISALPNMLGLITVKILSYTIQISCRVLYEILNKIIEKSSILISIRSLLTAVADSKISYYLFNYCLSPSLVLLKPIMTPEDIVNRHRRHMCMAMSNMIRLLGVLNRSDLKQGTIELKRIMDGSKIGIIKESELDKELIIGGLLFTYGLNRYFDKGQKGREEKTDIPSNRPLKRRRVVGQTKKTRKHHRTRKRRTRSSRKRKSSKRRRTSRRRTEKKRRSTRRKSRRRRK